MLRIDAEFDIVESATYVHVTTAEKENWYCPYCGQQEVWSLEIRAEYGLYGSMTVRVCLACEAEVVVLSQATFHGDGKTQALKALKTALKEQGVPFPNRARSTHEVQRALNIVGAEEGGKHPSGYPPQLAMELCKILAFEVEQLRAKLKEYRS